MTKRMILVGMVAMGSMAHGVVGQDLSEAETIAQMQAQAAQVGKQVAQIEMQNAQAQAKNAQTLVRIAQDQMKQRVEPGTYLGIASSSVSAELREQLKLKRGVGLVVQRVEKESPAEQAGVKQYDIVEKLDDQLLFNSEQFASLVRMQEPGTQVKLALIRQGQPQTVTATLVEKAVPVRIEMFDFPGRPDGAVYIESPKAFNLTSKADWNLGQNREMTITSALRDNVLTLRRDGDSMHLIAKDPAGNMLFEGDVNTDEEWSKVPPDVAAEAKRLMSRMKLPFPVGTISTSPRPPAKPVQPQQPALP